MISIQKEECLLVDNVNCSVNNCHYWTQGNICGASSIMITADHVGYDKPDSFDAPQASTAPPSPVDSCMETCCKTFVPKGSEHIEEDGVYK
ncbi:MAG TPA: DUF1540 domain-containing protein [Natronincola sp.]|nr:DUF1540 domain-containing protein [Natronincola sp.]